MTNDMIDLKWLEERGGLICNFDEIEPARTALVVIDMQDCFVNPQYRIGAPGTAAIVPRINKLAAALRAAGGMVAFTRHTLSEEPPFALPQWLRESSNMRENQQLFEKGSASHSLHDSLDVQPGDLVLDKHRYSAFLPNSSTLHAELRMAGIDTVIITGTVTNACCESSARDAHMLDYKVFFPHDASSAATAAAHAATLSNLAGLFADIRGTEDIIALLDEARPLAVLNA